MKVKLMIHDKLSFTSENLLSYFSILQIFPRLRIFFVKKTTGITLEHIRRIG